MNRRQKKILIAVLLAVLIFLISFLKNYPAFVETYYAGGVYPYLAAVTQRISGLFAFSAGDLLYMLLVLMILVLIIRTVSYIFKRNYARLFNILLNAWIGFEVLIVLFYLLWGINYFRQPASVLLDLRDTSYTFNDLKQVTSDLIDSANSCRLALSNNDVKKTDKQIFQVAKKAIISLSVSAPEFIIYHPGVKRSLLTPLLNYLGTAGYYNPFTSEAQMNDQMPVFLKPFVACHEMSHQSGFGREDEANFSGFLAGINSEDKLLKYSAYYAGVEEFMFEIRTRDSVVYNNLKSRISKPVLDDFRTDREYWMNYRGQIGIISNLFYDRYLKINNQKEGLQTYNRMIKLVMAWQAKRSKLISNHGDKR